MFALPKAVHAVMAVPKAATGHDERAEVAWRLRAAEEMDAAYARARVLMQNLADVRRRAVAMWN